MRPLLASAQGSKPSAGSYVPQKKELPMFSHIRDRIAKLEEQILPKRQSRVFAFFEDDRSPLSRDEQLSAFNAAHGVTQTDHLVIVTFA
jgi:hypothetical protein